jgi:two-component system NtrC family sensor kinase
MKYFCKILLPAIMLVAFLYSNAQPVTNLTSSLVNSQPDSNRVKLLIDLSEEYYFSKPDSCLFLANQAIELARKIKFVSGEKTALNRAGEALRFLGDYPRALEMQFKALELNRQVGDKGGEGTSLSFIGFIYANLTEYRQALNYLTQSKKIYDHVTNPVMISFNLSNIGNAYEGLNMLDSALYFQDKAQEISTLLKQGQAGNLKVLIGTRLGIIYARMNKTELALQYFQSALQNAYLINDKVNPSKIQHRIAETFLAINQKGFKFILCPKSISKWRTNISKTGNTGGQQFIGNIIQK